MNKHPKIYLPNSDKCQQIAAGDDSWIILYREEPREFMITIPNVADKHWRISENKVIGLIKEEMKKQWNNSKTQPPQRRYSS